MKVHSTLQCGFRTDGGIGPLLEVGENDFGGRALSANELEYIDALAEAKLVTILVDDRAEKPAPGKVVPIDARRRVEEAARAASPAPETRRRPAVKRRGGKR